MLNKILNRNDRETTYIKIDNLQDIEYLNNFNLISEILLKWAKIKKTKELEVIMSAMNETAFYVVKLRQERDKMIDIVSEYRSDKIRAIERARKAEEKLYKL